MEPLNPDAPAPVAEEAPAPPLEVNAEERLHLARERARHGDWEGARIVLEPLLGEQSEPGFTARYLEALSYEYGGSPDEALRRYDALLLEDPTDDVRFRRAETLGKLGRFDEAREALRLLAPAAAATPIDQVKVDVLAGLWALEAGNPKRAEKQLKRLVEAPPSDEPTFYLALARLALLERATEKADSLTFEGSDGKRARNLERRAALVLDAEHGLADLIRLGETEPALRGFVAVAGTYLDLGDDLLAEPVPRDLTTAQAAIYREELGKRVAQVWAKSSLYCDKGLEYAARQDWTSAPVPSLVAARALATSRVDGETYWVDEAAE
jgi:tetratricopeptide (TPR) repeat protein